MDNILDIKDVTVAFGGLKAINDVTLNINNGEILSIIGPNGAGKTTLFNAISGVYPVQKGNIFFEGHNITGKKPHQIARLGISRSFQNLKPFPEMTVIENILIAREIHYGSGLFSTIFRTALFREDEKEQFQVAARLVDFVGLTEKKDHRARNLTYGEIKKLEIARALALEPNLLLLDEPVAGMNPTETAFIMSLVKKIQKQGSTIVIIEHDMKMVMGISERIYVLDHGELIAEGSPSEIKSHPKVIEAYLGGGKIAHY